MSDWPQEADRLLNLKSRDGSLAAWPRKANAQLSKEGSGVRPTSLRDTSRLAIVHERSATGNLFGRAARFAGRATFSGPFRGSTLGSTPFRSAGAGRPGFSARLGSGRRLGATEADHDQRCHNQEGKQSLHLFSFKVIESFPYGTHK